jgi:subtilisin family serine protease
MSLATYNMWTPTMKALALAVMALVVLPTSGFSQTAAPVKGASQPGVIRGQYIVVMKSGATGAAKDRTKTKARAKGGQVNRDYGVVLKGYAASLPAAALAEVRSDPAVAYIEADAVVTTTTTQTAAPWGLDRIDQTSLPLNGTYTYTPTGAGVKAYVVDSGIRFSHTQFAGRAVSGFDVIDGGSADDCNGHGTHVAATLGGSTYGVAKGVSLVGVRVLDCSGSGATSGVIKGVEWVTDDHAAGQPAVANMSLVTGQSEALDTAVQNSIADGISYAVAAGNQSQPACNYSPARAANALTVASTSSTDARATTSNHGACVDVFAPGERITSAWHTSDIETKTISGTSMASPHVAGVAALYLQDKPAAAPATVARVITESATSGKVTDPQAGSPNRLLYSSLGTTPGTPGFDMARWATRQGGFWDQQKWVSGDFNADRRADLANIFDGGGEASIDVHLSNGSSIGTARWATRQGGFWDQQKWVSGDFNADGRADLANIFDGGGEASIDVHLSNGSSIGTARWATRQGGFWDQQKWVSGDFNADGRADLANIFDGGGEASIDVHLSNGSSFGTARWATRQGGFVDQQKWVSGDFNADGRADLANIFNEGGQTSIDVHLSNGSSFGTARWATRQGGFWDQQKWVSGDFNADGRADLANIFNEGGEASIDVHLSNGSSFGTARWATRQGGFWDQQKWVSGDFNADGRADLANIFNGGGEASIDVHLANGSRSTARAQPTDKAVQSSVEAR